MSSLKTNAARVAAVAMGGLALMGCATNQYVDEKIAAVNTRIDQLDGRVANAAQRADAAQAAANSANTAAQGAATDARTANQRLDQLTPRVDKLEAAPVPARTPRG